MPMRPRIFLKAIEAEIKEFKVEAIRRSNSQLNQEAFVLETLGWKRNGFFVEFGACDGVKHSNTLLLEREFGWTGILAEPGRVWHSTLSENRKGAIDTRCVWSETGAKISFNQTQTAVLSTVDAFSETDMHAKSRANGTNYDVDTVSLDDLLLQHNAPQNIEYLSVDTEGSELEILSRFNFEKYNISIMTVEHNYTQIEAEIESLLSKNGFMQVHKDISAFDGWFVNKKLIGNA